MAKSHQPRHGTLRDKRSLKDQALIVGAPLDVAGNAFALGVCGATRCFFSLTMDVRLHDHGESIPKQWMRVMEVTEHDPIFMDVGRLWITPERTAQQHMLDAQQPNIDIEILTNVFRSGSYPGVPI